MRHRRLDPDDKQRLRVYALAAPLPQIKGRGFAAGKQEAQARMTHDHARPHLVMPPASGGVAVRVFQSVAAIALRDHLDFQPHRFRGAYLAALAADGNPLSLARGEIPERLYRLRVVDADGGVLN